ncbi:MAG TPA: acyltransferase [Ignavibacteriales bacterium]|nr:acyltransferase [Ignavibacteriales bacterium]
MRIRTLRLAGYIVGSDVYISGDIKISDITSRRGNVIIGDRVSIGPGVIIVTDSSANNSKLTKIYPLISGTVQIEEDSWISAGVIILPNVKIGRCSIIAAGSIVINDVPPFSLYGGIPAKLIKKIDNSLIS